MTEDKSRATRLLEDLASGKKNGAEELAPLVYEELRRLADSYLRGERAGHTLAPTALVHEAFARLFDHSRMDWQGKTHFAALAAETMRRVLIDSARKRRAEKRGGGQSPVPLEDSIGLTAVSAIDVIDVHEALLKLESHNERHARLVQLRFFSGMTFDEVAHVMGVSAKILKNDWKIARAWLARQLKLGRAE